MTIKERAKGDLQDILKEGAEIIECLEAEDSDSNKRSDFRFKYQSWYSKALKAVELLASDRYEEFRRYYEPDPKRKSIGYGDYVIQDFLKGTMPSRLRYPDFDSTFQAKLGLINQISIFSNRSTVSIRFS
jgi:hypothetical protein